MTKLNALLVLLISGLAITGISFLDDRIWNVIFLIAGMVAYAIVGILFSIGILHGKQAGKDAYALVFFLLILGGWGVYQGLIAFKQWVLGWPLAAKIAVPIGFVLIIAAIIVLLVIKRKSKNDAPMQPSDDSPGKQMEKEHE